MMWLLEKHSQARKSAPVFSCVMWTRSSIRSLPVALVTVLKKPKTYTGTALKAVNREDKRSRRYRDRDFAKFERSRRYRDR